MAVTPLSFRTNFPSFFDANLYNDNLINFYAAIAGLRLNAARWSTLLDYATQLFIAHNLVLEARNLKSAQAGGIPGQVQGVLTGKHVSSAGASYDSHSVSLADMGFWGMSSYGLQFYQLCIQIGAGGVQIGAPNQALPGVLPWPLG